MKNRVYRRGESVLLDFNPWVFIISGFIIVSFVLISLVFITELETTFSELPY